MAYGRLRPTGKKTIKKDLVKIEIVNLGQDDTHAEFNFDMDYFIEKNNEELKFPEKSEIIIEAYAAPQKEVHNLGTLEKPQKSDGIILYHIYEKERIMFNLYIVKKEGTRTKILGNMKSRRADNQGDAALLPVNDENELPNDQIWKLEWPNGDECVDPEIWINKKLKPELNTEAAMKSPEFGGTIIHQAYREVLTRWFISQKKNKDDPDEKVQAFLDVTSTFLENAKFQKSEQEMPETSECKIGPDHPCWVEIIKKRKVWIDNAVKAYCQRKRWAGLYLTKLKNSKGSNV